MRSRLFASLVVILALLSGCGDTGEDPSASTSAGSEGGDENESSGGKLGKPTVEIADFGFGQSGAAVEGIVIVTTESKAEIGEYVTVTANFLDADGEIIATEDQVETFSWVGQELVLPVSHYLDDENVEVASIDPSAALSDYGAEASRDPLPVLEATEIKKDDDEYTASFTFTNETDADLEDLRVGVACYDDAEKIIGGTSTYPDLAPAGKAIRIDADVTVSEKPALCKAYLNYGE